MQKLGLNEIREKYLSLCSEAGCAPGEVYVTDSVSEAMSLADELASRELVPLIYVGGSTYVVSEATCYVMCCVAR